MQIYGPTQLHGAQPIGAPHATHTAKSTTASSMGPIRDELDISDAAQLVEQVHNLPEIRQGRVDAIRMQIAEGTYETDAKLDVAVGRLLDEIG